MTLRQWLIERHRDKVLKAAVAAKLIGLAIQQAGTRLFREVDHHDRRT